MISKKLLLASSIALTFSSGVGHTAIELQEEQQWLAETYPHLKNGNDRVAFYIRYRPGNKTAAKNSARAAGARVDHELDDYQTLAISLPAQAANVVSNLPHVVFSEPVPEYQIQAQVVPWNIDQFQARDVWDVNRDGVVDPGAPNGSGVKFCIIDTGFYYDIDGAGPDDGHPDFVGVTASGLSQISGEDWHFDGNGHGTHVAGTANAMNNNIGVVGVMPGGAELYIVKIFNNSGTWVNGQSNLGAAATACKNAGANAISMSLGGGSSATEEAIFQDLYDNFNIINIAAAGNDGNNVQSYPAGYPSVISVGALMENEVAVNFSQTPFPSNDPSFDDINVHWDATELSGGGANVLSTVPNPVGDVPVYQATVNSTVYSGAHIEFSGLGTVTGDLINGGLCEAGTGDGSWSGKVVLCQRGNVAFSEKVNEASANGGVAALIYNNVAGGFAGTCGAAGDCAPLIPALSLSQEQGQELVATALGNSTEVIADDGSGCVGCVGGYDYYSGTSMATPGVAAGVAWVWDSCGGPSGITNKQLRLLLRDSAKDLTGTQDADPSVGGDTAIVYGAGYDRVTGWGLVQLKDALELGNQRFGSTCPIGLNVAPAEIDVCTLAPAPDADYTITLNPSFTGTSNLSESGVPAGASSSWSLDPVVFPDDTSIFTVSGLNGLAFGSHSITLTATDAGDPSNNASSDVILNTFSATPATFALTAPADSSSGVGLTPTFTWAASSQAVSYHLEVATDMLFSNIVVSEAGLTTTSHTLAAPLASNTTHYWRVTADNPCGNEVSAEFSFTTVNEVCSIINSTDVPKSIIDASNPGPTPGVTNSLLNSGINGFITDLNVVSLAGTHTYINDLSFNLISPNATNVEVIARSCGSQNNFDLNLDDEAAPGAFPCPPVGGGTYQPSAALSAFDGENALGNWTMRVTDHARQDTGSLNTWGLEICYTPAVVNNPAVAIGDTATVNEDSGANTVDVLANDSDAEGDPFVVTNISAQPANGTVAITNGGADVSYTPDADYCNDGSPTDDFTYEITGGDTAIVAMTVTCVDDGPAVAADDAAIVAEDSGANVIDVLANDTADPDDNALSVTAVGAASNGATSFTANDVTYTPDADYCGADSFTYTINGGDVATVSVDVTCVDDGSAIAADDAATVAEDSGVNVIDVLANDTADPDDNALSVTAVGVAANGTTSFTAANVSYEPNADYCGADSFSYTINGGDTANVTIDVTCVDDGPAIAADDAATVVEDSGANVITVLANDTPDLDDSSLNVTGVGAATNGATSFTANDVSYTPNANYCGADSFTYSINGGDSATVTVTVTCVDDPAEANPDSATVLEDSGANTVDVLLNDTDIEGDAILVTAITAQPANGVVAITNGGADVSYTPNLNYCNDGTPTDDFTYEITGGATATVAMSVTCVEDLPTGVNDTATVNEDDPATTVDVMANDTDPDGGANSIQSVTQPTNGTVIITNGGADLTYQPNANYCNDGTPTDDFTYTLNGGSSATVSMSVVCVDDLSVANADSDTVGEDSGANTIDVLANDTDVEGDAFVVTNITLQPTNGVVAITNGGADVSYTPNSNYCNDGSPTDDFNYEITGGSTATVAITVTCVDDLPTAVNDSATMNEDAPATTIDVQANDNDSDGGTNSIQSVTQPANGTVLITNGGADLTYQPNANYCNDGSPTDDFTYTLNGGSSATVFVTVSCVDDGPAIAADDAATVVEDSGVNVIDVLANDTADPDDNSLSVTGVGAAANGSTSFTAGNVSYSPDADYCGADSFNYTINGGDTATVSITVTCVDDGAAVAADDAATVVEDSGVNVIDVLANDTADPDDNSLSVTGVGAAANGSTSFTAANVSYSPDADYCGADSFTYTINGGDTATVSVTVTCVDDGAAVAADDAATVVEDSGVNVIDVLANDTADPDDNSLSVTGVGAAANGSTSFTAANVSYSPDADYCGADSFTYTINGGDTATVSVTVTCVDDGAAVAADDAATVVEDSGVNVIDVLANDTADPDDNSLSITGVGAAANGSTSFTAGNVSYSPDADYCGADSFTYTINGGDTATVSITVTCVDDGPAVAADDAATVVEDSGVNVIDVLANDTPDPDDNSLSVTGVGTAANGSTSFTAANVSYSPDADYCGADSFTYTINGGDTATVSITVTCVDDGPAVATDDIATVVEDSGVNVIDVLNNDAADPDDNALNVTGVGNASNGVTNFTSGNVSYTPNADYCGPDSFVYEVNNGDGGATVTVDVTCVDDAPVANADSYSIDEDSGISGLSVLDNDFDADGDQLVISTLSNASNGTVTLNGSLIDYEPDAEYCGTDSFTYSLVGGNTVGVDITVNCVNDQPSFVVNEQVRIAVDQIGSIAPQMVACQFDMGPDNEDSSQAVQDFLVSITDDTNGVLSSVDVDNNGQLSYVFTGNQGTATLNIQLQDNGGTANNGVDTSEVLTLNIHVQDYIFISNFENQICQ